MQINNYLCFFDMERIIKMSLVVFFMYSLMGDIVLVTAQIIDATYFVGLIN
jgi:hypothetical protein